MLKLHIDSFRGISDLELDLVDGVNLIAGPNGAGKTSICDAVRCLLRGPDYVPLDLTKKEGNALVRAGSQESFLELSNPATGAKRTVHWPDGKSIAEGPQLEASEIALGIAALTDHPKDDTTGLRARSQAMAGVLKTQPTRDDLVADLKARGLSVTPENEQKIWERLQNGDSGWEQSKTVGQQYKGEWRGVTGQDYGMREAERWQPPNWNDELATKSEESLRAAVTEARHATEAVVSMNAVSDADRRRFEEMAATLPELATKLEKAQADVTEATGLANRAEKDAKATPKPAAKAERGGIIYTCAYTEKPEMIQDGVLVTVDAEKRKATQEAVGAWEALQAANRVQQDRLAEKRAAVASVKKEIETAEAAKIKLASLDSAQSNEAELEAARRAEQVASENLSAFEKKSKADRIHRNISVNQQVVALLSPEGLRQKVLARALAVFNEELKLLCQAAGWLEVTVDANFLPRYGGFQYRWLSESEQYRVRATLQVAIAKRENAPLVVLDRADLLDGRNKETGYLGGRNQLISMLKYAEIPSLVAMMLPQHADCPSLEKIGGTSSWLEKAV